RGSLIPKVSCLRAGEARIIPLRQRRNRLSDMSFENLGDLIRRDRDLSKVAVIDLGGEEVPTKYTYAELDAMTMSIARALTKRGFARGDRIAILSVNRAEYLAAYFGIMRAGFVAVPVNYRFPRRTIHFIIQDAGAKLVFCDPAGRQ